jgi:VRR-NUC domain
MGLKRGWPDFVLIPPTGQLHCLELKRLGEKLSEDQIAFQTWCIRHGVPHSVCRTIDEVLAGLDHWQCLRIKIAGRAVPDGVVP